MDFFQAIVLAIVQGLSEFLPISSSGHLILIPHFVGWTDQGLAFDVAVHLGTLLAVLIYFRRQLGTMAVAWFTLTFFGILMYMADRYGRGTKDEFDLSWPQAFAIGCAQALALMPGTSRSGITMTAGRALGLTRSAAARFSFLLAVPGIGAAGAYEGLKLVTSPDPVAWQPMVVGVLFAALSGIACIHFLIRFIERIGLLPFTVYRLILAAIIVWHFA